jgi:hypothetical protein
MTSRIQAHVSQRLRMFSTLQSQHRLHHSGDCLGIFVMALSQRSDDFLAALGRMILIQLPLTLNLRNLNAEADDLT